MNVARPCHLQKPTQSRQKINGSGWLIFHSLTGKTVWPEENTRSEESPLKLRPLVAPKTSIPIFPVASVVRSIDNQGIVQLP